MIQDMKKYNLEKYDIKIHDFDSGDIDLSYKSIFTDYCTQKSKTYDKKFKKEKIF